MFFSLAKKYFGKKRIGASSKLGASNLNAAGSEEKESLALELPLTALVDCFSILVIYLLLATSFGTEELDVKDIQLPKTVASDQLASGGVIVSIRSGKYFIDDKEINLSNLVAALKSKRGDNKETSPSMIIMADKKLAYADLNPVVLSGLQAGFSKVSFAVIKEDAT